MEKLVATENGIQEIENALKKTTNSKEKTELDRLKKVLEDGRDQLKQKMTVSQNKTRQETLPSIREVASIQD